MEYEDEIKCGPVDEKEDCARCGKSLPVSDFCLYLGDSYHCGCLAPEARKVATRVV